jgi:hypothetical protein
LRSGRHFPLFPPILQAEVANCLDGMVRNGLAIGFVGAAVEFFAVTAQRVLFGQKTEDAHR